MSDPQAAAEITDTTPEQTPEVVLDDKQVEAIQACVNNAHRLVCVTGQAGSGKTTIMRQVYKLLTDAGHNVAVCAPTGKAAKRVYEATGIRARTMHLLLEYTHPGDPDPKTGKPTGWSVPRRNNDNPLAENIVIADEYAMVNRELHRNLVSALPAGGRLLAFGDINQLPPIETTTINKEMPSPFRQLMSTHKFPTIVLDKIHRQGEGSGIIDNSRRILQGLTPMRKSDFDLVISDDPLKHLSTILRRAEQEKQVLFRTPDHQVIVPSRKGWVGSHALNGLMQQMYERKDADCVVLDRWDEKFPCTVRLGSKVIQTKNDYNLGVFNGETGLVTELNMELGTFVVDFGDRVIEFPPELDYEDFDFVNDTRVKKYYNPQKNIELAYALTTHKCQGSEYGHVIYVMNKSMFGLQIRSNLYTGVTRARKHVTLLSDQRSIMSALKRTEVSF